MTMIITPKFVEIVTNNEELPQLMEWEGIHTSFQGLCKLANDGELKWINVGHLAEILAGRDRAAGYNSPWAFQLGELIAKAYPIPSRWRDLARGFEKDTSSLFLKEALRLVIREDCTLRIGAINAVKNIGNWWRYEDQKVRDGDPSDPYELGTEAASFDLTTTCASLGAAWENGTPHDRGIYITPNQAMSVSGDDDFKERVRRTVNVYGMWQDELEYLSSRYIPGWMTPEDLHMVVQELA
jgi:hypothetical protein